MTAPKLAVEVVEWKAMERNTLRGFVTIRVPAMRLTIKDLTAHEQGDKRWVGLPGKAQIDRDQNVVRKDGKVQYSPVLAFDTKEVAEAFGGAVLRALDARLGGREAA